MAAKPDVQALLFDVFGTVVDWRSSIVDELTRFGAEKRLKADWAAFTDDWRGLYQPAMDEVRTGRRAWTILDTLHRERATQPCKVTVHNGQLVGAEPVRAQARFSLRQLDRVGVQRDQSPARPNPFQKLRGVPTVTQRCIHTDLSRLWLQHLQNLLHHDRAVCPRRRFAGFDHPLQRLRVFLRRMLLVLFGEFARMLSGISRTAFILLFIHLNSTSFEAP